MEKSLAKMLLGAESLLEKPYVMSWRVPMLLA
jgi:hypothetical protein